MRAFESYANALTSYLTTLENRLFSEGLHTIGEPAGVDTVFSYLDALYSPSPQEMSATQSLGDGQHTTLPSTPTGAAMVSVPASGTLRLNNTSEAISQTSAAASGASTERNQLENRRNLAPETLRTIAAASLEMAETNDKDFSYTKSNSIIFRAIEAENSAKTAKEYSDGESVMSGLLKIDDWTYASWETNKAKAAFSGYGVNWYGALTDEDKFALQLLKNIDVPTFVYFQWLQWCREWGNKDAREQIQDLILTHSGLTMNAKSGARNEIDNRNNDIKDAIHVAYQLARNPAVELSSLIHAIEGGYVPPAPGGDLIRDGAGVLPTGSNIHALDPYRIPSNTALRRGQIAAEKIIRAHRQNNDGAFPETVAVTLWGLDVIKTKGESIGIVLGLIGAEPVREATGRIVSFDLIPPKAVGEASSRRGSISIRNIP